MSSGRVPLCFSLEDSKSETCQPEGRTSKEREVVQRQGLMPEGSNKRKDLQVNPDCLLRCEGVKKEGEVSGDLNEVKVLMKCSHHLLNVPMLCSRSRRLT